MGSGHFRPKAMQGSHGAVCDPTLQDAILIFWAERPSPTAEIPQVLFGEVRHSPLLDEVRVEA